VTIQDVGSIGELIGAVATVATLLYLATQIRQNTATGRATAAIAANQSNASFNRFLAEDQTANRIFWKGLATPRELSEAEWMQFTQIASLQSNNLQQSYALYHEGSLSASSWHAQREAIRWFATQPGFQKYWDEWGAMHEPGYASFVNELIHAGESAAQHLSGPVRQ
jgi:hypothetical protein